MLEPTARIRDGDGCRRSHDGVVEGCSGLHFGFPQVRFELRPEQRSIGDKSGE